MTSMAGISCTQKSLDFPSTHHALAVPQIYEGLKFRPGGSSCLGWKVQRQLPSWTLRSNIGYARKALVARRRNHCAASAVSGNIEPGLSDADRGQKGTTNSVDNNGTTVRLQSEETGKGGGATTKTQKERPKPSFLGGRPGSIRSWLGDDGGDTFAGWSFPPSPDGRTGGLFRGLPETAAAIVLAVAVAGVSYRVFNRSGPTTTAPAPTAATTSPSQTLTKEEAAAVDTSAPTDVPAVSADVSQAADTVGKESGAAKVPEPAPETSAPVPGPSVSVPAEGEASTDLSAGEAATVASVDDKGGKEGRTVEAGSAPSAAGALLEPQEAAAADVAAAPAAVAAGPVAILAPSSWIAPMAPPAAESAQGTGKATAAAAAEEAPAAASGIGAVEAAKQLKGAGDRAERKERGAVATMEEMAADEEEEISFPAIVLPWSTPEVEEASEEAGGAQGGPQGAFSTRGGGLPLSIFSSFGKKLPGAAKEEQAPAAAAAESAPAAAAESAAGVRADSAAARVPLGAPVRVEEEPELKIGRVIVPAVVDSLQKQAFVALQALQVIAPEVQAGDMCTRREYARWLISASSMLNKTSMERVFPAMFVEGVTELAFDDVQPEDQDFAAIQGLAEAGLIPSRLSRADLACDRFPPKAGCSATAGGAHFRPDSPLTRQDMIAWKVAMEHPYLPDPDTELLEQKWGIMDVEKIDRDSLRAVALDLSSGSKSAFTAAFGYTRRLQPRKPVTCVQAASALAAGEAREAVAGELERIEAEMLAQAAVETMVAAEVRFEKEQEAEAREREREREDDTGLQSQRQAAQALADKVKQELEAARLELEAARREREEDRRRRSEEAAGEREAAARLKAAAEAERETLLMERLEVERRIEALMAARVEAEAGKDQVERLRLEAEGVRAEAVRMREAADAEREEMVRARTEVDAERRALLLARSWAEEEAKKAREHASKLENVRKRWEAAGLEVNVDAAQQSDETEARVSGPTWEFVGKESGPGANGKTGGLLGPRQGEVSKWVRENMETKKREASELWGVAKSRLNVAKEKVGDSVASGSQGVMAAVESVKARAGKVVEKFNAPSSGTDEAKPV